MTHTALDDSDRRIRSPGWSIEFCNSSVKFKFSFGPGGGDVGLRRLKAQAQLLRSKGLGRPVVYYTCTTVTVDCHCAAPDAPDQLS